MRFRIDALFSLEDHAEVEVSWSVYQNIIDAYRDKDRTAGLKTLSKLIDSIKAGVPKGLSELAQLGRTLHKRRDDILAFFDHPGTSNGPTEAINAASRWASGTWPTTGSGHSSKQVGSGPNSTLICEEPANPTRRVDRAIR